MEVRAKKLYPYILAVLPKEGIKFLVRKGEHRPTEKLLERKGLLQD